MASGMHWTTELVKLIVYLSLTAEATAEAVGVCDPNTDITSWRPMPYNSLHSRYNTLIRVEVKEEGTNYFTEYDEFDVHFPYSSSKLFHFFANGKTNTVFSYYYYYLSNNAFLCASDQFMPKQVMRRFENNGYLSQYFFRYIDDNTTVRDIPVDHWQYCVDGNNSLDLYFSRSDIGSELEKPPLRIVEKGVSIKRATFDFIIDDHMMDTQEVLAKAVNDVDCIKRGWPNGFNENIPVQPRSYSATVVMVFTHQNHATTRQYYYDSDTNLASSRVLILPGSDYMKRFGHGYVTIVTDYDDGLQYVIDVDQGNCTIEPLSRRRSAFPFSGPWDPASVHTPASPGLFELSAFNLKPGSAYKTKIRDVDAEVWSETRVDWPRSGVNSTVHVFYNSASWATEGIDIDKAVIQTKPYNIQNAQQRRLLGLAYHTTDDKTPLGEEIPEFTHVYDYRAGSPDFSVFDVSACYGAPSQVTKLTISVRACYGVLLRHDPRLFEAALHKFIVDVCGITPIRVNSIEVDAVVRGHVDVHIQLLDIPLVNGKVFSRSSVTLEDAVRRLGLAVDQKADIGITVNYPEGATTIMLIPGSLRTYGKFTSSYEAGHTGGTVALVACGTLLVGLLVSPATAYVIWKKNIAFPYFSQ